MSFKKALTVAITFIFLAVNTAFAKEKYNWSLGCVPDKEIVYLSPQSDVDLKLHVFLPEGLQVTDQRAAIIFFFGGGWKSGSPTQFYAYSEYLASRGMVAISAEYRTAKQKAIPRNCVEDGREAVRYVRAHASKLGIDPNRIAAGGGSAGGHVAAAIGMCPKIDANPKSEVSSSPNALVLFNPVYHNGEEGYGYGRIKNYWQDISPFHNIRESLPATITFFGTEDIHIGVPIIDAFQAAMEQAGNISVTHKYDGQKHGFFNISKGGREVFKDVLSKVDHFLVQQNMLEGEAQVDAWVDATIKRYQSAGKTKAK